MTYTIEYSCGPLGSGVVRDLMESELDTEIWSLRLMGYSDIRVYTDAIEVI